MMSIRRKSQASDPHVRKLSTPIPLLGSCVSRNRAHHVFLGSSQRCVAAEDGEPWVNQSAHTDFVLTSKWNKPFPVTLLPAGIGIIAAIYFAERQSQRQQQILSEIRAASEHNSKLVEDIEMHSK